MANTKISEMEEASSVSSNDILPIVQGGNNKKVTLKTLSGTVQGMLVPDSIPIGTVVEFASDTNIPENWLLCNGQAVSRTEYDLLFAIIGTTWGEGDGSTTFNVPTKEGLVTVGKKSSDTDFDTLGKTGGEKTHKLTRDELAAHSHSIDVSVSTKEGTDSIGIQQRQSSSYTGNTVPERTSSNNYNGILLSGGGDQPHNNLQPYVTSNFIIKARQSAGVVATVVDGLDSDSATDALSAKQGKELNDKINNLGIMTGSFTPADGITIVSGNYIICGKLVIVALNVKSTKAISQWKPIVYLNDDIPANGYIYTIENKTCYINKTKKSIDIYADGGLASGSSLVIEAVACLDA